MMVMRDTHEDMMAEAFEIMTPQVDERVLIQAQPIQLTFDQRLH